MSFASYSFLFDFLPFALVAVWLATVVAGARFFAPALAATSIVFYAASSIPHLILLMSLIALTWIISQLWGRVRRHPIAIWLITLGVLVNLSALAIWKYGDSLVVAWNALGLVQAREPGLMMPLGISFYALQQIGYLADLHKSRTKPSGPVDYAAFVLFFPQLLAGPIVKHKRMMAEFARVRAGIGFDERLQMAGQGFFWIAIGLFKKAVIADSLGRLTIPDLTAAAGGDIAMFEAWRVAIASMLRIYFDFSGYSDMAVGLGLLFGVRLPVNFNAPFRVSNFREGWRQWHITFHQFIRDHVYAPLRRMLNDWRAGPMIAMLLAVMLSALWHVDNVQFLVWGLGVFVLILIGMRLSFRPGRTVWGYIGLEVILCGFIATVFVSPDGGTAATILLATIGVGENALDFSDFDSVVDGLTILAVASVYAFSKTEISTQTLISGARDHSRRHIWGWRPPVFQLNFWWGLLGAFLFLSGVWFTGFSAPFIYFQF